MIYMKNLKELGFPKHCVTQDGKIYSLSSNRYLSSHRNKKGYLRIRLEYNKKSKTLLLHRIVALMFLDDPDDTKEVNHIDGNKTNNHYSNLEFCTSEENIRHAVDTGLREMHYKLTEDDVHSICKYLQDGLRNKDIADITGFSASYISSIKTGKSYPEISCQYNISYVPKKNKISVEKIADICKEIEKGNKNNRIAKKLNVSHKIVELIKKRVIHQTISCNYHW